MGWERILHCISLYQHVLHFICLVFRQRYGGGQWLQFTVKPKPRASTLRSLISAFCRLKLAEVTPKNASVRDVILF